MVFSIYASRWSLGKGILGSWRRRLWHYLLVRWSDGVYTGQYLRPSIPRSHRRSTTSSQLQAQSTRTTMRAAQGRHADRHVTIADSPSAVSNTGLRQQWNLAMEMNESQNLRSARCGCNFIFETPIRVLARALFCGGSSFCNFETSDLMVREDGLGRWRRIGRGLRIN